MIYRLLIAYKGTHYHGWQLQPNGISIQEEIEKALAIILRESVRVIGAGRTDAGVHALGQVAHFQTDNALDLHNLQISLNGLLPKDIRILSVEMAHQTFHAQYSAISKVYRYHLFLGKVLSPFVREFVWHIPYPLNLEELENTTTHFIGKHDFTSFANEAHTGVAAYDPIRTITRISFIPEKEGIAIEFEADGFLYKMVRNIMGMLVDCSRGKRSSEEIPAILEAKDRRKAAVAAPPQGLFLVSIQYAIFFLFLLSGCEQTDHFSDIALKRKNQKGEYIFRTQNEITPIPPMEKVDFADLNEKKGMTKISKEYFRCKGSSLNPAKSEIVRGEVVKYHDCGGAQKHSLPLREGKEWVYPILIEILNDLQQILGKRVVITSGHRCPEHNTYVDPSPLNQFSKHQIGAEVDFYVQGLEDQPEKVIASVLSYYSRAPKYSGKKEFTEFKRYEKGDTNVSTKPWMNKEIFIKLYKAKEGRNFDNRHPYPYISIQVRNDLEKKERVVYSWEHAFRNFLRY